MLRAKRCWPSFWNSSLLRRSKSLSGKVSLFVPEGRLRIAQDFSPGPRRAENFLESRRDG